MPGTVVLHYPVKTSSRFAVSLLLLHVMAAIVVFATAMPLTAKLLMLLPVSASLAYYLARDVLLLLPASWREISLDQDNISVVVRDGSGFSGRAANQAVVSPYFVILSVKLEGRLVPVSRVLFPDSLSPGAYREFCVHLKFA